MKLRADDPRPHSPALLQFLGIKGFGFTKENELFVGRVAQLGFAASLIGEAITGKGALAQFDFETGAWAIRELVCGEGGAQRGWGGRQCCCSGLRRAREARPVCGCVMCKAAAAGHRCINACPCVWRLLQAERLLVALPGMAPAGRTAARCRPAGLPLSETEPLLLFFIAFTLLAAINEGTGEWVCVVLALWQRDWRSAVLALCLPVHSVGCWHSPAAASYVHDCCCFTFDPHPRNSLVCHRQVCG